jgi:hypothetical protein
MNETVTSPSPRPTAISVICILGFIGAALTIPLIFSDAGKLVASWYPAYLASSAVVGLICMIGLWKMLKWSVFLYAILVVINQVVLMKLGVWNMFALIIPAIVVAIAFMYIGKMK